MSSRQSKRSSQELHRICTPPCANQTTIKPLKKLTSSPSQTYNLLTNRANLTSQRIASESTSIAHEARQDSAAMRTIAVLTMFFLPATFVSSLFGTNFFTLDTSAPGKPALMVSELWWVYLIAALPLTLLTLLVWMVYLRRRAARERGRKKVRPGRGSREMMGGGVDGEGWGVERVEEMGEE